MTEVPEHLLRRAKERRSAMSGEPAGEAGGAAADATSKAVEPASAAAPAPAGGGGAPAVPTAPVAPPYTGPPPSPPRKQRVPGWAMPVLVALPLWAVLYGGAFGERATSEETPVQAGSGVYKAVGCAGCHGAGGGGGIGPAMDNVVKAFPEFDDHVAWIRSGSAPFKGQPYGAEGTIATGGMPGFPNLSDEEVIAVVCHERVAYAKAELPPECDPAAAGAEGDSANAES